MKKKRRKLESISTPVAVPVLTTTPSARCLQIEKPYWSLGKTTYSPWAGCLSSAPDVPTGSDSNLMAKSVTEDDEKPGLLASPFFKKGKAGGGPSDTNYIRFLHHLTDNLLVKWESILFDSRLFVQLPSASLHQGGRDSLVELLDIAEEQLPCSQVIIMFNKNRQDFSQLIRTFKFMGFEMLPPSHKTLPPSSDHFFMAYSV